MNEVTIEIDDETKRMTFGETLTSGSIYSLRFKGVANYRGQGNLVAILPIEYERLLPRRMREVAPVVAAANGVSLAPDYVEHPETAWICGFELDTEILAELAGKLPGQTISLDVYLHMAERNDDGSSYWVENVAVGKANVILCPTADAGRPSRATVLYRGPKGDKGDNGLTPQVGPNGNWWIGTADTGIPAQGAKGDRGMDAILRYVKDPATGLYHEIIAKKNILGQTVLVISGEGIADPKNNWATKDDLSDLATKGELADKASLTNGNNFRGNTLFYENPVIYSDSVSKDSYLHIRAKGVDRDTGFTDGRTKTAYGIFDLLDSSAGFMARLVLARYEHDTGAYIELRGNGTNRVVFNIRRANSTGITTLTADVDCVISSAIAAASMPSSRRIDGIFELNSPNGTTGQTYTAPANGWLYVRCESYGSNVVSSLRLYLQRSVIGSQCSSFNTNGRLLEVAIPVMKGDVATLSIRHVVPGTYPVASFVYANAEA